jgi:hypothetical protein
MSARAVDTSTWSRRVAVVGGAWGVVASAYLFAASVDKHTISVLHNESARRSELGYSVVAFAVALVAVVVALTIRSWMVCWVVGLLGLVYATAAAMAVDASDQPQRLVSMLVLVGPPLCLLTIAGVLSCAGSERRRFAVAGFVVGYVVLGAALVSTWLEDPIDQARLFGGLQSGWALERAVDNVYIDDAGRVWGVQPWEGTAPADLYLRDRETGAFELVGTRDVGWPPMVIGSDASGQTWFVSSDADDPFVPLIERYQSGRFVRTPRPQAALPPLDAVALAREEGTLFGLHSNFSLPARAVLEVLDGPRWRTVATPISHAGRLALVDAAVGREGELWVWHDGRAEILYRYDGSSWSTRRLPFDVEPSWQAAPSDTALDPFRTFISGDGGRLWLHDRDAGRLVGLLPDGSLVRGHPMPADVVPLVIRDGVAWCRGPSGLLLVDARGDVLYDSTTEGMPDMEIESVAVGETSAWVRAWLGDGRFLVRFDYRTVT